MGKAASIGPAGLGRVVAEESALNEKDLIAQARNGDLNSFSALVEIYQERVVHIANAFVGNFEDARDIAQEAFVKAYEHLSTFRGESRFYTWLYRIVVNLCKDFLRKRKRRQQFSFWFGRSEEDEVDPVLNVAGKGGDAAEALVNEELGVLIQEGLEKLPFRQKSAFALRYLEGLSLEEIAHSMNTSVGAVKANLWIAANKMKAWLKKRGYCHEKRTV